VAIEDGGPGDRDGAAGPDGAEPNVPF